SMRSRAMPSADSGRQVRLEVRRAVRASQQRVFELWTDPGEIVQWWGPPGVTCPEATVDLRVGGEYRIANRFPDGQIVWIHGRFEVIDEPNRLVYTWQIETDARRAQHTERVTVRFEPAG